MRLGESQNMVTINDREEAFLVQLARQMTPSAYGYNSPESALKETREVFFLLPRFMQIPLIMENYRLPCRQVEVARIQYPCRDKNYTHIGAFIFSSEKEAEENALLMTRYLGMFSACNREDKVRMLINGACINVWMRVLVEEFDPEKCAEYFNIGFLPA